jgi:probable F420-dependent oxidoreductase
MAVRPFRFGLQTVAPASLEAWQALARSAEEEGYATLMVPDHLGRLSTFPSLMAAAAVTSRIKLASYVLNQDFRPPGVLALEATTVHLFTGGRLELGLGAGWAKHEYVQAGIQFDAGPERVERFGEYARIVKDLLRAADPYSFGGRHFVLKDYMPLPKFDGAPPPLLIGGGSPVMLRISGEIADIISVSTRATPDGRVDMRNLTLPAVENKVRMIQEAAGDRFGEIEMNMTVRELRITNDRAATARELLTEWAKTPRRYAHIEGLTPDDLMASPHIALGTVDQIVEQFEAARERWGFNYLQVSASDREASGQILSRLRTAAASPA